MLETPLPVTDSDDVIQLKEEEERFPLEGLYLNQHLGSYALALGRPLVFTAFVTDRNGIVAKKDENGKLRIPPEIKNSSDWRLFQELMAQSDLAITSSAYLRSWKATGKPAQDTLFQYEPGEPFEKLGDWRLSAGFERRSPDLAVVCHSIDFELPQGLLESGRRIFVFTTDAASSSPGALALKSRNVDVVGAGETGVDGARMVHYLSDGWGYSAIMMVTGPAVLDLLLRSGKLDMLYVSEAQVELECDNLSQVRTILPANQKAHNLSGFTLAYRYLQQRVRTDAGTLISQLFLRYDREGIFTSR